MKSQTSSKFREPSAQVSWIIASICTLVLIGAIIYSIRSYSVLQEENESILLLELEVVRKNNVNLSQLARYQQSIIDSFQGQIQNIGSTVGTLEKLSKTDKELLRKYSKVYFLNENYVPEKLAKIDNNYVYGDGGNFLIHTEVWSFLKRLLDDARVKNIDLLIASAFRSFDIQATLKSGYTVVYGAGTANQFSADQGYSEHQLGTSVDFTTKEASEAFSKFESDPAYKWLVDNPYKYGFILSYPEGNSYYKFEPWHWRFVGVELATYLHVNGKYFYDLEQRDIDSYLIKLFD